METSDEITDFESIGTFTLGPDDERIDVDVGALRRYCAEKGVSMGNLPEEEVMMFVRK
ncbi:hypothetical protein [Gordonibacter sp. Marseille-P4307]|uniref:hypothetical protein n=1 Tax=Gordonibacter sp. Marseille-P4307 TaxID=2161815 RepID=UPI0013DE7251|nr:hypothetical protein [Gordonibacter sp. Marseille-P4307]